MTRIPEQMALLGQWTQAQTGILNEGLSMCGIKVISCRSADDIPDGSLVAVRSMAPVSTRQMEKKKIPFVISGGSGLGNIEQPPENTTIETCPGTNSPEVAAHAVALLIIGLVRGLGKSDLVQTTKQLDNITDLSVGIVGGSGNIGTKIVILLQSMGFHEIILGRRPDRRPDPKLRLTPQLETTLDNDLVFIATGASGLIQEREVKALKKRTRLLVNVGRGNVISPKAVTQFINTGAIYHTDVWPNEPQVNEPVPETIRSLFKSGARGTPHAAAQQSTADQRVAQMVVDKTWSFLANKSIEQPAPLGQYQSWLHSPFQVHLDFRKLLVGCPDLKRVTKLMGIFNEMVDCKNSRWQIPHVDPEIDADNVSLSLVKLITQSLNI